MVTTKTERVIDIMRNAGRIVALAHAEVKEHIKAGVSTQYLNDICERVIIKNGATPSSKGLHGYLAASCISVNEVCHHGIPSSNCILMNGDILSIDIGACYKGYHGDSAWTYSVGQIGEEATKLLKITEEALYKGLAYAKVGNRVQDISWAIGEYITTHGYSTPLELSGHGIGTNVHEDPPVPNFGVRNRGIKLKKGMTLAIEPIAHLGRADITLLDDGWTVVTDDASITAHFEHTIVITDSGYEILTTL